MTDEPIPVGQPKHPLHAMTTYELRDYRHQLERAIAFFDEQNPVPPVRRDLQARRELRASLALARPDSPAQVPIVAQLVAVEAELARRDAS